MQVFCDQKLVRGQVQSGAHSSGSGEAERCSLEAGDGELLVETSGPILRWRMKSSDFGVLELEQPYLCFRG